MPDKSIVQALLDSPVMVALVSSVGTLIGVWLNKWWENKNKPKPGHALVETIERANDLYKLLWEILDQFGAKRCCIFEFHNGGKYYSGRSIQRVTMSHEVASYGLPRISREFQGTVMSDAFHIGLKELIEMNTVYYQDVDHLPDNGTKALLQYYKSKSVVAFLFLKENKDPIACWTVCFDRIKPIDYGGLAVMQGRASEVEQLLKRI